MVQSQFLRKANAGSRDAAYDRARKNIDRLAMEENGSSRSYLLRVRGVIKEHEENKIFSSKCETDRHVISNLSPRFGNKKFRLITDPNFKLDDSEDSFARVEEALEVREESKNGSHALTAVQTRDSMVVRQVAAEEIGGCGSQGGGNHGRRDGRSRPPRYQQAPQ